MSDTVGKLVIGVAVDSQVKEGGEKAKADARKLKKEMDSILSIGTPLSFSASKHLVHNNLTLQAAAYDAARKAQIQGAILQSTTMFGTGAMGRAAYMSQRDFVAMAMGSWEKNKSAQLRTQIQVADEISKREQAEARNLKAQALRDYRQQTAGLRYPSAEQALYNVQQQKARVESAEMKDLKRQEMKAYRQQVTMMNMENRAKDKDAREAEKLRRNIIMKQNQEWREAQRQQSNAARMDPANNLRRGFVGGMFGSPVGTASTIGGVAAVGALAGFAGGMAARAVSTGIHLIERSIIGLGRETIKTSSDIEMLRLRLDTITNGKGVKFFNELYEAAIDLRAPVEGMIKSFSKMTAMGFQPTMEQLKGLVNYTRMLGDPENLDYIVLAFSQIASKGKLEMQELRQLAERGLPALSIIQQKLNIPMNKIGDIGKLFIPGGKAVKALLDEIMVRTGDIQEKYKKTMAGMIDYTKLLWFQFKKEMGDSGMYESFKSLLGELIKFMESPGFRDMAKDIGLAFSGLFQGLQKTVSFIEAHKGVIGPLFKYLGIPMTGAGMGAMVGGGIGLFVPAPGAMATGAAIGAGIGGGAGLGGVGLYDLARSMGASGGAGSRPLMTPEFNKIESDIDTAKLRDEIRTAFFKSISSGVVDVVGAIGEFWEAFVKGIKSLPTTLGSWIKDYKNTYAETFKNIWKGIIGIPSSIPSGIQKGADWIYGVGGIGSNKGLKTDASVAASQQQKYLDDLDVMNKTTETLYNNFLTYIGTMQEITRDVSTKYADGTQKIRLNIAKFFAPMMKKAEQVAEPWKAEAVEKVSSMMDETVLKETTDYFSEFTRDMANATVSSMKSFQDALAEVAMDPFSLSVRKIKEQAKTFGKLDPSVQKKLDDMVKAGDISQYEADRRKREMLPSQDQLDAFVKNAIGKLTPTQWESPVAGSQATRQSMFGIGNPMATVASNTTKQLELTKQGNEQSKLILNAMLATGTGDLLTDQSVLDILLQ